MVLFTLTYFKPYVSGITVYIERLTSMLAEQGSKSTVLTMKFSESLADEEIFEGGKIIRAKPLFKLSKGFVSIDQIYKSYKLLQNSRVVVISLPQPEGIFTAVLAKLLKVKIITIYHCEVDYKNKFVQTLMELAHKIILKLSDEMVTYTNDYLEFSRLLRPYTKSAKCLYPPVPKPGANKDIEDKVIEAIKPKAKIIGFAGRLASEKGFEGLLEAVEMVQQKLNQPMQILVAGPMDPVGEEAYKKIVMKLIKDCKVEVTFLGTIPASLMGTFYKHIDLLALPSINSTEAFGMVQVEAMKWGVPVVVSDLPGVREAVSKTGMGKIFEIRNTKALAEAIIEVLREQKKLTDRVKLVDKLFDYKNELREWEQMLDVGK